MRKQWPDIVFSHVYKTAAQDVTDQADFLNAAARLETDETPEEIHAALQTIEKSLGKAPPFRFGPRTIDLDILLYENAVLPSLADWLQVAGCTVAGNEPAPCTLQLVVPHARMHLRRFVLEPLCELIDPNEEHPVLGQSWKHLHEKTLDQDCKRTELLL